MDHGIDKQKFALAGLGAVLSVCARILVKQTKNIGPPSLSSVETRALVAA